MAAPQTNLNALNGLNPLSYLGVNATTPPQVIIKNFSPISTNNNFAIGTIWINDSSASVYMLVSLADGVATWLLLVSNLVLPLDVPNGGTGTDAFVAYSVICGGDTATSALQSVASVGTTGQVLTSQGAGALPQWSTTSASITVTGNTGGAITNVAGNFDLVGDGTYITSAGTAGTITFSGTGSIPSTFDGDTGSGTVADNTFTINGDGGNISTAASAHKLVISLATAPLVVTGITTDTITTSGLAELNSLKVSSFTAGVLTSNGSGVIASGAPLSIANGGTNATTFTTNGVSYYNGTSLVSTAAPTGYQILGNIAGTPSWINQPFTLLSTASITESVTSIIFDVPAITSYNYFMMQYSVSTNAVAADSIAAQLWGVTADAYITTGYTSGANYSAYNVATNAVSGPANVNSTDGFVLGVQSTAAVTTCGTIFFNAMQSQLPAMTGNFTCAGTIGICGGDLAANDTISKIKLTTAGGNNFVGGQVTLFAIS